MGPYTMNLFFLLLLPALGIAEGDSALFRALACGNCHSGLPESAEIYRNAPSFRYAGVRYNPAYLFDYLKDPVRIRKHIGASRMPDFRFNEQERLALTLFLMTQRDFTPAVSFPPTLERWDSTASPGRAGEIITRDLKCTACHSLRGRGGTTALDLSRTGARNNPHWLVQYLALPQAFDPQSAMPAQMFSFNAGERSLHESISDAATDIQAMTTFMMELSSTERGRLQAIYERARSRFPFITARHGELIFRFQNCAACHEATMQAQRNAPDLSEEARRVKKNWLKSYLARPTVVRPFGFHPGTGSRMPDYRLSPAEQSTILEFIFNDTHDDSITLPTLSHFARRKAERMIRETLPCLGCHQFDRAGGRIGPDMSGLKSRLQPSFVLRIIEDPQHTVRESIMPKVPMQAADRTLIATFLANREKKMELPAYLPLIPMLSTAEPDTGRAAALYAHYCSPCHGIRGGGNGFNARFLPVPPTNHTDAALMRLRTDDTLFDGIYSGGAILNKNHLMPGFGQTLAREDIRALVRYLRQLCSCEAPRWSNNSSTAHQ
jgi:mono/diheme cytochrome c family protein